MFEDAFMGFLVLAFFLLIAWSFKIVSQKTQSVTI